MVVNEVFGSIDGEGLRTGELTTFIRLAGCNIKCRYCDTLYANKKNNGKKMSIEEILSSCRDIGYKNITLTGGEPLIHQNIEQLVDSLIDEKYCVNIETNGTVDIESYLSKNCLLTVDYKTPSSGMNGCVKKENFTKLRSTDVLKFVMSRSDFESVESFLKTNKIISWIYFSPIFNELDPSELVDFLKELHSKQVCTNKCRVQVQLHKILWHPNKRGV